MRGSFLWSVLVVFLLGGLVGAGLDRVWFRRAAERAGLREADLKKERSSATDSQRGGVWSQPAGRIMAGISKQSTTTGALGKEADFLQQLAAIEKMPDGQTRLEKLAQLMGKWAEVNPETAYEHATRRVWPGGAWPLDYAYRDAAIGAVLGSWARRDPARVLGLISGLKTRLGAERAWRLVVGATASVAPAETMRVVSELPGGRLKEELAGPLGREWAGQDPQGALAWALSVPAGQAQVEAMAGVFEGWAGSDPKTAALAAAGLPPGEGRSKALEKVAGRYAQSDPAAALIWLNALPLDHARDEATQAFLERGLPEHFRNLSPAAAEATVNELFNMSRGTPLGDQLTVVLAGRLAEVDPVRARDWVLHLEEGGPRNQAITRILAPWARQDPAAALDFAMNEFQNSNRDNVVSGLASYWGRFDPQAALEFAKSLELGHGRENVMAGVLDQLANVNPRQAADNIRELPADRQLSAAEGILQRWTRQDPASAAAWAEQFPDGEARTRGLSQVAREWGLHDAAAAGDWLETLPDGEIGDRVIESYVSAADGYDILMANQWAARIQDPQQRASVSGNVFRRWLGENRAQAIQWLQTAGVDGALRQQLQAFAAGTER